MQRKIITEVDDYLDRNCAAREIAHYEIEKSLNKWVLYTTHDRAIVKDSLKEIVELFMEFREIHYKLNHDIEIYDRDRKILYKKIHRIIKLFDILEERDFMYKRMRSFRANGVTKIYDVKKHDPKILRPILRDEKTW